MAHSITLSLRLLNGDVLFYHPKIKDGMASYYREALFMSVAVQRHLHLPRCCSVQFLHMDSSDTKKDHLYTEDTDVYVIVHPCETCRTP